MYSFPFYIEKSMTEPGIPLMQSYLFAKIYMFCSPEHSGETADAQCSVLLFSSLCWRAPSYLSFRVILSPFPAHPPSARLAPSALSFIYGTEISSSSSSTRMNFPVSGFATVPHWKSFLHIGQLPPSVVLAYIFRGLWLLIFILNVRQLSDIAALINSPCNILNR